MSLLDHPERAAPYSRTSAPDAVGWKVRLLAGGRTVGHHLKNHVGVGIVCSVAYFDPGNWSVDLQAGSTFGYRPMLFVILMAGLGAIVLQSLAYKLGCVTGLDLATHCRLLLHDRPRHRRLIRYAVLYPLYVLSELAIISTDLAELLGSAIGLCLIFPSLSLWAAVLLTATDVLIFLVLGDPSRGHGRPVKLFEISVMALVAAVFVSFVVLLVKVAPQWNKVFLGFVPSETLFHTDPDALYIAVGILGATVMPHALFLGSYLATQDRVSSPVQPLPQPAASSNGAQRMGYRNKLITWASSLFAVSRPERRAAPRVHLDKYERENNDLGFIRAHLSHGLVDVIVSLLAVAVPINSAILVIAAAVFFTNVASQSNAPAGLFDAHDLIKERISNGAAFIFALALLCAGQTASITATLAGQIVSEGFIEWRVSPFLRRIITRLIGLVPSMVVAIAVGRNGINTLLVASQVALAIVLPFVAFPLIWLTSSKSVMSVRKPVAPSEEIIQSASTMPSTSAEERAEAITEIPGDECQPPNSQLPEKSVMEKREDIFEMRVKVEEGYVSFASSRLVTLIASLIFLVIVAANFYVVVVLAMGGTA